MGEDDEDEDFASKSKLPITVKTLSKYNERIRVTAKQTNKQTNKQTHTQKLAKQQAEKQKNITRDRQTSKLTSKHIHRDK